MVITILDIVHVASSPTPIAPPSLSCRAWLFRSMESDLHTWPASVLNSVMQANWPRLLHVLDMIKLLQKSHHNITRLHQWKLFYDGALDVGHRVRSTRHSKETMAWKEQRFANLQKTYNSTTLVLGLECGGVGGGRGKEYSTYGRDNSVGLHQME